MNGLIRLGRFSLLGGIDNAYYALASFHSPLHVLGRRRTIASSC